MYRWKMNSDIERDLGRIELLRGRFGGGTLPRRWTGRLRRELEAESIAASTSMEGVNATVDEVRRILAGEQPGGVSPEDIALVEGYRDAMSYVLRRGDDPGFRWQSELILTVHNYVMAESFVNEAGRYRTGQVFVAKRDTGVTVYTPPDAALVPALAEEIAELTQDAGPATAGPVQAALVHIRIAGVHPFRDGNGRTARVLSSLAMYRAGYTDPRFTSLEEWWGSHRQDYYAAFACLGDVWDASADVTPFIQAHVRAQRQQINALSLKTEVQRQIWQAIEDLVTEDLGGPARWTDALFEVFSGRAISNSYYRSLAGIAIPTASVDLAKMKAAGLIEAVGRGRSSAYIGTIRLLELLANELKLRERPTSSPLSGQREWFVVELAKRAAVE